MHFVNTLIVLGLAASTALADSQINFYSDFNCQTYIGSGSIPSAGGQITGPSDSHSAMFITLDTSSIPKSTTFIWGFADAAGNEDTSFPRVWTAQTPGTCGSVTDGPILAAAGIFGF